MGYCFVFLSIFYYCFSNGANQLLSFVNSGNFLVTMNFYTKHQQFYRKGVFFFLAEPAHGDWTEEAIDRFEEWTHVAQWKKLSAKMDGYCIREKTRAKREGSPVPGVELFDVSNGRDIDIARELVSQGFAVYKRKSDGSATPGSDANSISSSAS